MDYLKTAEEIFKPKTKKEKALVGLVGLLVFGIFIMAGHLKGDAVHQPPLSPSIPVPIINNYISVVNGNQATLAPTTQPTARPGP